MARQHRRPVLLEERIKDCKKCSLYKTRTTIVMGEGDYSARYMLVGEAPGKEENKQNRPFVGDAGQRLRKLIKQAGLNINDFYITNICKCWPGEGNRTPTKSEIEACLPYLIHQINQIKPEIIFTLGNTATLALLGNRDTRGITKIHGQRYNIGFPVQSVVIPLYHPSYLIRNGESLDHIFIEDLKFAVGIIEGEKNKKKEIYEDLLK